MLHQAGSSTIDGASYTVDSAGNRTSKTDQRAAVTSSYTYDAIYQLTQAMQGATTTESYSYDPVGNRTASLGVSSYTTNASNELTATSGASYTYDSNGNTLTKVVGSNTTTYAWDYENRLTSVTLPSSGGTVSFKYDPFGRRIEKLAPTTTSIFAYDNQNMIEETNASGVPVARYAQTDNTDEPLALLRSGTTSFYHAGGLGSVTSLTNGAGSITETYTYDSFGKQTATSGSLANPFQYTGRELDPETSLYYYRARYYDPSSGKFLNEDPIRFHGGSNFYAYVGNSAVNHTDPSGLWSPEAHDQLIWNALHPCGVSNSDIWEIQQGSRYADSDVFQGAKYSYMHAMRDGTNNQSVSSAENQTASFIATQMQVATNQMNAGVTSQAMFTFGLAMHPIMDRTSPAHTDPNGNPIPWCGFAPWSCSNLAQHGGPWSIEDLSHLNAHPEVQDANSFLIRNWFETLTGKKLNCCSN